MAPPTLEQGKACSGHSPRSCLDAAAFSTRMPATSAAPSVGSVDAGLDWTAGESCEDSEEEEDEGGHGRKYARGGSSEAEERTRLRRSGRNHPTDAKRVRQHAPCMRRSPTVEVDGCCPGGPAGQWPDSNRGDGLG